jgi:hypothetical protein
MTAIENRQAKQQTIGTIALEFARTQLGQSENPAGSNRGPMVDKYLQAVGLPPGYAWCQAFVYWCYDEAAKQLAQKNPVVRTAGVFDCWNKSAKSNTGNVERLLKEAVLITPDLLLPGDQFIMTFGKGKGHTGIIERVEISATQSDEIILHTIEGNSNVLGSREGIAVVRHRRSMDLKSLRGFIKYK